MSLLDLGRSALRDGDGEAARRAFERARDEGLGAAALEGLGQAAYVLVELDEAIARWQEAYAGYREAGEHTAACRTARNLAGLCGSYLGDWAVAQGWLARARRLVDDSDPDSTEIGWIALTTGMFEPDRGRKNDAFAQALAVGSARGDTDLFFTALAYFGASLVHEDRVEEGMLHLDEALAAVLGGDVGHPVLMEEIFCQLFSACEHAHDLDRADQWMRAGDRVAQQRGLVTVAAFCRTHYGGLLTAAGRWPEAEEALSEGLRLWALGQRTLRDAAVVRLAELRLRQGRLDEARALLEGLDASGGECARPLAALLLATGRPAEATDVLDDCLAGVAGGSSEAVPLLSLLVEARLAEGDVAAAKEAADRMAACVAGRPVPYLQACVDLARGRVALALGEGDARRHLLAARDGFRAAQFPLEYARATFELAVCCADDRPETALAEARAAYDAFERLRAARHVDAAAALLRRLGVKVATAPSGGDVLTRREAEVLELLGEGLTNPEIAARLFLSRKTVEHHVGNVLGKLGLRSRAEAAAYSVRQKLAAE